MSCKIRLWLHILNMALQSVMKGAHFYRSKGRKQIFDDIATRNDVSYIVFHFSHGSVFFVLIGEYIQ